ncbi:MAG: hypothetical protein Q4P71_04355 [Actinomycetaceae bacterium]|nr:hypothetical protein [Actinomycetaceae bacterium]
MHDNDLDPARKPATPPWLLRSFIDAAQNAGSNAPVETITRVGNDLIERWNAPFRTFHNVQHLANVIARIDELAPSTHDPDILRLAAWFLGSLNLHSVEFGGEAPEKKIDVCHSYVSDMLRELGFDSDVCGRVCSLIQQLFHHHAPADDIDANALIDANCAVLAAMPQEYKRYRRLIREEFPHLTDLEYQVKRRRYIRALLNRSIIFRSPLGSQWEPIARQNLEAELVNLDCSISKLDPTIGDDSQLDRPDPHADEPTTATLVFKRSGVKRAPREAQPSTAFERERNLESEATAPSADSAESADSDSHDTASSLESEPDFLEPIKPEPPKRLSAKKLARETGLQRKLDEASLKREESDGDTES